MSGVRPNRLSVLGFVKQADNRCRESARSDGPTDLHALRKRFSVVASPRYRASPPAAGTDRLASGVLALP